MIAELAAVEEVTEKTEESPWIDDQFRVAESPWGSWCSFDRVENKLVTSLTKELCVDATRFYLKGLQEGFSPDDVRHSGSVDGKL